MKQSYIADAVVDFSASTGSVFKLEAEKAGKVVLDQCFLIFEELVGNATTQGVASLLVGGSSVATYTSLGDGTEVVDSSAAWAPDGVIATAANPYAYFDAGDDIDVQLTTQATGGTTTGTARAYLVFELADA